MLSNIIHVPETDSENLMMFGPTFISPVGLFLLTTIPMGFSGSDVALPSTTSSVSGSRPINHLFRTLCFRGHFDVSFLYRIGWILSIALGRLGLYHLSL